MNLGGAILVESRAEDVLLTRLPCVYLSLLSWDRGWTLGGYRDGRAAGPGLILICAVPGYGPEADLTPQGHWEAFPWEYS